MTLALLTSWRVWDWSSDVALWAQAATLDGTVRAHVNYRAALMRAGYWHEAIDQCGWLLQAMDAHRLHSELLTDAQLIDDITAACPRPLR